MAGVTPPLRAPLPASVLAGAAISHIVRQHAEELAILWTARRIQVTAPHVALRHLRRLDDRMAAHLDGLTEAGAAGTRTCAALLERAGAGELFAATLSALINHDSGFLAKLFALAEAVPAAQPGFLAAFNLVSAQFLKGAVRDCLHGALPFQRRIGIAICPMHAVEAGPALDAALADVDPWLRAEALRVAGESGRVDLLTACAAALTDENALIRFRAARALALLGERHACAASLLRDATRPGPQQAPALLLALRLIEPPAAREVLRSMAQGRIDSRLLVFAAGTAGDPAYVPWLIGQMADPALSRSAGAALALISGIDLALQDLDGGPPPGFEPGPDDDPEHDDVALADDEGLPWPDPVRIKAWWDAHGRDYPSGVRCFMGAPPTVEHCRHVLRDGYQRQRIAAAEYLCLLQPGTKLFQTAAPAWRQERWLKRLG